MVISFTSLGIRRLGCLWPFGPRTDSFGFEPSVEMNLAGTPNGVQLPDWAMIRWYRSSQPPAKGWEAFGFHGFHKRPPTLTP